MCRGVSAIKYELLLGIHILIDPFCPSLQRPSVCFGRIKLRVDEVTFFVVVLPALVLFTKSFPITSSSRKLCHETKLQQYNGMH